MAQLGPRGVFAVWLVLRAKRTLSMFDSMFEKIFAKMFTRDLRNTRRPSQESFSQKIVAKKWLQKIWK
jgi:hypothetical protein